MQGKANMKLNSVPSSVAGIIVSQSAVGAVIMWELRRWGATNPEQWDTKCAALPSVCCVFGHRDDEAARWAAKYLATELKCNVSVAVGIHIDHADGSEIQCLLENCREACRQFKDRVRADRLS